MAVTTVDAGPERVNRSVEIGAPAAEIIPPTAACVTETFDYRATGSWSAGTSITANDDPRNDGSQR